MDFTWVIIGVFVLLVVVALWLFYRWRKGKVSEWQQWAESRGWEFHQKWPEMRKRFRGGPFRRGYSQDAWLGFEGVYNGVPVMGFRYEWTESNGDGNPSNDITYVRLMCGARLTGARLPDLNIRPEIWGNGRDIQFENSEFNKRWHVKCDTPRFAHDMLHPRAMELMLANPPRFERMWCEQDHILIEADGKFHKTDEVDNYLEFLTRFVGLIPPFVYPEIGAKRPEVTDQGPSQV